ncbi:TRCF domain-containing protein [Mesorhizobium sp. IMUNJ 23232]|uniref:TRCF domain-containing protein n=1 Tax=Mesorhizobium sp. IMUNJ 23232 TaxID=3376064 RepID=UPI003794FF63
MSRRRAQKGATRPGTRSLARWVPEPVVRLNLYSRLQRLESMAEIDAFADELEDRFGLLPPETITLLDLARLKLSAAAAGIVKIGVGPVAIAIEFARVDAHVRARLEKRPDCIRNGNRFVVRIATKPGPERLKAAVELVKASQVSKKAESSDRTQSNKRDPSQRSKASENGPNALADSTRAAARRPRVQRN